MVFFRFKCINSLAQLGTKDNPAASCYHLFLEGLITNTTQSAWIDPDGDLGPIRSFEVRQNMCFNSKVLCDSEGYVRIYHMNADEGFCPGDW